MTFHPAGLAGAFHIEIDPIEDERGFFARAWCADEAESLGLNTRIAQCNISLNRTRGTLRGLHFQAAPHGEAKLVRCIRGSIFDVIVDIRRDSATYGRWWALELTARNRSAVYAPEGFAHGFQTLEDDTEVYYQMSAPYVPHAGRGIRWNDSAFRIAWPLPNPILSARDAAYPDFSL